MNQVEGDGGWTNDNYNAPQPPQQQERASGSNGQVNQVQRSVSFGDQQQQQQQQQTARPFVRRIFNMGVSAMSSGDCVRVVSNGGVGAVSSESRQLNIILDSGSDVSLLPESFAPDILTDDSTYKLKDCQGQKLTVKGLKRAELLLCDEFGEEVLLKQNFVIGQVTNGILSLGQLMKRGWTLPAGNSPSGTVLQSPDGSLRLPIEYQGSSLALSAHVRCIQSEETDVEELSIRAIVSIHDELEQQEMGTWSMTNDNVAFMRYRGHDHVDGRGFWGHYYPFRTTLISVDHRERKAWKLVELNHDYLDDDDCGKPIPECNGVMHDVLVLMSGSKRGMEVFMKENLEDVNPAPAEAIDEDVEALPQAPEAVQQGPDIGVALNPPVALPQSITIQDVELRPSSSVYDLRQAAKFLGISQAGSKTKIYERVCTSHLLALRRQAVEVAEEAYQRDVVEPRILLPVRQPSDRERMLHNMTHLPFRSWCPHCIACKSHDSHHPQVPPERVAEREFPVIQLDLFYGSGGSANLLLIDMWTRYTQVLPLRMKSASVIATSIINFLGLLGYFQQVEISCDSENVLVAGVNQAKILRNKVGATLIPQFGKNYSKGRTAMAERAIQTVRNQGKTLIHCLEDFAKVKLPDKHVLHSWSYLHAGWLLNHFHVHSALKCTPYQTLMGRPYRGRICSFGPVAYGLDGTLTKNKPTWIRGIWVGKDQSDQDLLVTGDGQLLRAKAVRQTGDLWDAEALSATEIGPEDLLKTYTHSTIRLPSGLQPLPAPVEAAVDSEAEAVAGAADSEEDDASGGPSDQGRGVQDQLDAPLPPPLQLQPSDSPDSLPEQSHAMTSLPQPEPSSQLAGDDAGMVDKRPLEEGDTSPRMRKKSSKIHFDMKTGTHKVVYIDEEDPAKRVKHSGGASASERPEKSSRTGEGLCSSPTFAGNISQVKSYAGVEMWVDDEEPFEASFVDDIGQSTYIEDYIDIDQTEFPSEADGPPDLSASELEMLDNEAGMEEIKRLFDLNVLEGCEAAIGDEVLLDTRCVFDWRYRDGWRRRCRLVAREFNVTGESTSETFSPTSTMAAMRMLLVLAMVKRLNIVAYDVKDAFLTVDQVEKVLIHVPSWVHLVMQAPPFWLLKKCLPGQRNAAMRWSDKFRLVSEEHGFESFPGMPTIFRHISRELFLTIHVDDILVIGSADDIQWYDKTFKQIFTMKNSEMCSVASGGEINYLKKRITCMVSSPSQAPGILLQPNKSYIPKLVQMFKLDGKKSKSLPHHADLSVYHAGSVAESDWLKGEEVTLFRSGLGIALYLAQDRPDIQHTVRVLSSFMGSPTKKALVWLKHHCLYLKNSEDYGLFYPESEAGTTLPDHWCFPHGLQNRQKRADYVVEVFSDSNWGGCTVTRKSTSSAVICVGGCVVHSHSRGQTSVALSSCEAELLASSSALSEGLQLTQVLKFLLDDKQEKNTKVVETVVDTDSSSSRSLMMRKGQGRLKHLSIRHLWIQSLVKLGMVEIIKIDTKNNPADLNTKALSAQRRKFLMSLMNMWCDGNEISFTVQVPGHDELAGVVARVILALSSLPTTKGMSTEVGEQKEFHVVD